MTKARSALHWPCLKRWARAEAKIHDNDIEKVHFHEVGAVDAMVDITCAAVGAHALGVDEIVCSPLNVGGGTVKCAHGVLPVPVPATVELLQGAPVYSSGIQVELVTPTGAAIVKTLVKRYSAFPAMTIEKSGYGAGSRDFPGHANVVRLTIGESQAGLAQNTSQETISVLEANLDDLNPQVFGYVVERLLEAGALDTFAVPVQMKKNRPGMLLTVLAKPEDDREADSDHFHGDQHAGGAAARRTTPDFGAKVDHGWNPMGRHTLEDWQLERHRHELRSRVRRLQEDRGRASRSAEERHE